MHMKGKLPAVGFAVVVLLAAGARADTPALSSAVPTPNVAVDNGGFAQGSSTVTIPNAGTKHPLFGWAGIGLYSLSVSQNGVSATDTDFGINLGAAYDLVAITPDLPLSVWANIALAFASDYTIFPITLGAAVHYDKLPVQLLGGLGFTIMPHSGSGSTPVGLAILLHAAYPLPQIKPGISAYAQFQYHFLDDGFDLLVFDIGLQYGF
jgi:hypothetical protein